MENLVVKNDRESIFLTDQINFKGGYANCIFSRN